MKKRVIMIACCLLVAGAGLIGIGMAAGGTLEFSYALGGKVITDSDAFDMQTETVESFDSIDVKLNGVANSGLKLELIEGDAFSVTFPKDNDYFTCSYQVENGVLKLETKQKHRLVFFQYNFLNFKGEQKTMQVTVPKDTKLSEVKVVSASGDVLVNTMQADKMSLSVEYGDLSIADCETKSLEVSDESGDVSLSNSNCEKVSLALYYGKLALDQCDLDVLAISNESGDVSVKDTNVSDARYKLAYGDLKLENANGETVNINLESGDARLENMILGQLDVKLSYGNLSAENLTVKTLTGSLESGSASLYMTGKKDAYSLKLTAECGNIKVDGEKIDGSYQYDARSTDYKIDLKNEYGDIKIEFEK